MVHVKICGITNLADARAACDLGAYALGLNFYEKSPRVIAPATAWNIRRSLPDGIQAVGVFVNWKPAAVIALCTSLQLSAAQLHGDESTMDAVLCSKALPVIKAFRVPPSISPARIAKFPRGTQFLLDAAKPGQYGGSGHIANWTIARRIAATRPIILAGGLTPENVAEAIRTVRPHAVDVASGVESRAGKKDRGKMREFFREVERANRDLASAQAGKTS
jgi:phosphoribosylanthranilate isomerase